MHGDDQRPLARLAVGAQKPGVDVVPVGMRDLDMFDWAVKRTEPFAAVIGEPAELAVVDGVDVRRSIARCDDRDAATAGSDRVAHDVFFGQRFHAAVRTE
jgi:hypothetical protein